MLRRIVIAATLLVLCVSMASGEEIDAMTGLPAPAPSYTPLPSVAGGTWVLWDLKHGVYFGYEPSDRFSDLVGLLVTNGFVVTTSTAGVDVIDLSNYSVVVVCAGSAANSAYTPTEVAALQDFVANGGGLLVMGDNPDTDQNPNINPVTTAFGTTCGLSFLEPFDYTFTNFVADPIFNGISSIYYRAGGELDGSSPSVELAFGPEGKPTVAGVQSCSVVVTGDINFCDNDYLSVADNEAFALNIFNALAGISCVVPVEPTTWGAIKATYR